MKTYCVSATGFTALTDIANLMKFFHTSMIVCQDSVLSVSFEVACNVA